MLEKIIKPFIPQIINKTHFIDEYINQQLKSVEINDNEGYAAAVLLPDAPGNIHVFINVYDANDKLIRTVQQYKLKELLETALKNLK